MWAVPVGSHVAVPSAYMDVTLCKHSWLPLPVAWSPPIPSGAGTEHEERKSLEGKQGGSMNST